MKEYFLWLGSEKVDAQTKGELKAIEGDNNEIQDRFYKSLEFGTGGLRGVLGAGKNRINVYTIRKVTQGLAQYINGLGEQAAARGVAISFDSRINSDLFAAEAARVLAANGIKAYLFSELSPVPELSFAVRHFGAVAGIMITASHNPPKYNGYKVYGDDGGQLTLEAANIVLSYIEAIDIFDGIKLIDFEEGKANGQIQMVGEELDRLYLAEVKKQQINPEAVTVVADELKLIYTPLHGSGNKPVRKILEMIGFKHVVLVPEQVEPDGTFRTVKSPNPEEKDAFTLAIEIAKKENIDLIIGTDPDCDRVGVVVRDQNGEFLPLTGNMVGVLLTEYILAGRKLSGTLPSNGVVIKTIVTTNMSDAICKAYDVEVMNVLTGFKFIGEKIKEFEENNNSKVYLFGFEESYGYLAGTYARDKDAVVASMLIAEMAAWYKLRNMSLYQGLLELYDKYGVYRERLVSITLEGVDGVAKIGRIMEGIRNNPPTELGGVKALALNDYEKGNKTDIITGAVTALTLPKSDVLVFELENNGWFAARPSGTEPKIKFYFGANGITAEEADATVQAYIDAVDALVKSF